MAIEYRLAAPVIRADLRRCRIESRVVLDLDTGLVVGHYGRCAADDDPTESKHFQVTLSEADRGVVYRRIRDAALAAGALPPKAVDE